MKKKVCMVVYSYYPRDPRVRKEAEALCRNGYELTVICLRQMKEVKREIVNGVEIIRLPMQTMRGGSAVRYIYQYIAFTFLAFFMVSFLHLHRRYSIVHAHSLPDFIVFAALMPRLSGSKVILDLHEGMPEIFMSRLGGEKKGTVHSVMIMIERISSKFASQVITVSDYLKAIFVARGIPAGKIEVVYNVPDSDEFMEPVTINEKRLVYAGTLNDYQDFNTVLDALGTKREIQLDIYGEGSIAESIEEMIRKMHLENVRLIGWVSPSEMRIRMRQYSGAILPFVKLEITRVALGHKVLEYTMQGLPVIASDLPGLKSIFSEETLFYYTAEDEKDFTRAMNELLSDAQGARKRVILAQRAMIDKGLTWNAVESRLLSIYARLTAQ